MINVKELRIGNWVKHGDSPSSHEFTNTVFEISIDTFFDMARSHISEWNLDPIPLTPDLLIKCGFEFQDGQIEMCRNKNIWMHFDGESLSANFGHIEQLDVSVNSLHQLQNLYFALTGEELKINL